MYGMIFLGRIVHKKGPDVEQHGTKNVEIEDNIEIRGTEKNKHLRCIIAKDREIMIAQTRTAIKQLQQKKMTYTATIQSIIKYSAELWITNKKYKGKILVTEIENWRRCCGLTKTDRITNDEIRRRIEVTEDTIKYIETKKLYGHAKKSKD
ncbi:hypothetical protein FQA39_LY11005 [Lamprigera yunnana]|nr:hypothetical protein FQA39_LY11005 [Lamprigera yunnana]